MVVFTCNNCGESVKKISVEKHYNGKCRRAPISVSCMDCMKDFYGNEYAAHIRCITELEKYSGKDYVPKESLNSGQKKQDSWMETVRSILATSEYNLTTEVRGAFQRLEAYDNVPRKKAKFENFIKNCLRLRNNEATQVWVILEKEIEKTKKANAKRAEEAKNKKIASTNDVDNSSEIIDKTTDENNAKIAEDHITKKEKKKSKKRQLENENTNLVKDSIESVEEPVKKKKSKKGQVNEDNTIPVVKSVDTVEEPIKKKKSKKNLLNDENTIPVVESVETNDVPTQKNKCKNILNGENCISVLESVETIEEPSKKKKSKKNLSNGENCISAVESVETNDEPIKKKKKNSNSETNESADVVKTNGCIQNSNVSQSNIKVNGNNSTESNKFEWCSEILKLTGKNSDGIPVDNLKKKVLKKYFKKTQTEISSEKQERKLNKTFIKYLKKCNLKLENDVVSCF